MGTFNKKIFSLKFRGAWQEPSNNGAFSLDKALGQPETKEKILLKKTKTSSKKSIGHLIKMSTGEAT